MTNQSKSQTQNIARLIVVALLFVLCGLFAVTATPWQDDEADARILGDKRFRTGRQRASQPRPQTKPAAQPAPGAAEVMDAELIGVTFWRLSPATAQEEKGNTRLLIPAKKGAAPQPYHAARISDDIAFRNGELLWLGIEIPRADDCFVYVLDREQYADGSLGDPYLIFPAPTTPEDANVASAGRTVYVPAPDDPLPYFRLERSEPKDKRAPLHVAERLTIIVSPRRLVFRGQLEEVDTDIKLLRVATAEAARCDREWTGKTQRLAARRNLTAGLSAEMTRAEQEVRETRKMIPTAKPATGGTRRLLPADLLPHTIYRVQGKAEPSLRELANARVVRKLVPQASADSDIRRLRYTRGEADAILALVPAREGMRALDFDATRALVESGGLSQYRYVHFATHGLADGERSELSTILLSLFDAQGRPLDGFLRAHEVYNLNLPAELVVLSACETGLGKLTKGEGLVSLTRGFMYAGAARVVVSLWAVNDRTTAELMAKFYRKILVEGERPAAALRAAQIEMWRTEKWEAPYYWAAFTLQGEWR